MFFWHPYIQYYYIINRSVQSLYIRGVPEIWILHANGYEYIEIPLGVSPHTLLESVWQVASSRVVGFIVGERTSTIYYIYHIYAYIYYIYIIGYIFRSFYVINVTVFYYTLVRFVHSHYCYILCRPLYCQNYPMLSRPSYSFIHQWLYSPLLDTGRFFIFVIFYTVGRTPRTGDQPVARQIPVYATLLYISHACTRANRKVFAPIFFQPQ
jgi:hypothetical protein